MLKLNTVAGYNNKFKTNYGKEPVDRGVSCKGKNH
jgi:hypothetical protein